MYHFVDINKYLRNWFWENIFFDINKINKYTTINKYIWEIDFSAEKNPTFNFGKWIYHFWHKQTNKQILLKMKPQFSGKFSYISIIN